VFPAIRQGGVETGVAVVAEDPRPMPVPVVSDATAGDGAASVPVEAGEASTDVSVEFGDTEISVAEPDVAAEISNGNGSDPVLSRLTIHTARYRLTLKGVDRGKWEVDVVAEADAPLEAVDKVVRGVQRRAGEGAEPDRLSGDAFREALETPIAQLERA
jgi:hypothetical protein